MARAVDIILVGFSALSLVSGVVGAPQPASSKAVPVVAVAKPAPAAKSAKAASPVQDAQKPSFPTDWMKPGNIMKYDLDADPMKNRIDSSADDVAQAHAFNLKHVDLLAKKKPAVEVAAPTKAAAKMSTAATAAAKTDAANDWMKPGNIMKYDLDADPMKNRIDSSADDVEQARAFNLKHVDLVQKKKPAVVQATQAAAAAKPAPAAKSTQTASPAQDAQKSSFPTDWMKPGNIMKYDLDADPMKNRIDSSADDVAQAHAFNLKHVDLLVKKKPAVEQAAATKAAPKASTPAAAATKPEAAKEWMKPGNEWMQPGNILKYDLDADPMKNRIDSSADDVEQARAFNLKHVDLLAKKAPVMHKSPMEFLYVSDE